MSELEKITLEQLMSPDERLFSSPCKRDYCRLADPYSLHGTLNTVVYRHEEDPLLLKIGFWGNWTIYHGVISKKGLHASGKMPIDLTPEQVVRWWNEAVEMLEKWKPEGERQ